MKLEEDYQKLFDAKKEPPEVEKEPEEIRVFPEKYYQNGPGL